MRASRLVNVLLLLQTRGRMTADELARELEVSARTVQRDLEALGEAGVPVYVERGRHGGARLVEGYRTRLTGLTSEEAEALFLSGLPGAAAELGLGTVLAAAQLKVLAALPPELRARASRIRERFYLDAPGWFRTPDEQPHLAVLASCAWSDRRVRIVYRREEEVVERTIEPMGLVLKGGTWYVVARRSGEMRTYRVSRIEAATPTDERFERPARFDLAAHWDTSAAAYEESFERVAVTVRLAPDAIGAAEYVLGETRIREAIASMPDPDSDGWLRLTVRLLSLDWAHDDLLRLGAEAEVLAPPALRERIARTTRAMAARYGDSLASASSKAGTRSA